MDTSGSMGSTAWNNEETFVSNLVETGLASSTNVGVIQFGSAVDTIYNLTDDQTRSSIATAVTDLDDLNADATRMADAYTTAINLFDTQGTPGNTKAIILLTDGTFSSGQDPFSKKSELDAASI